MNDIIPPGNTVITYSEVLADLQHQFLVIFAVCGAILFLYVLFNIFVKDSKRFNKLESDTIENLPEQITGCFDYLAMMFALFVCLSATVCLFGINI